MRSPVLHIGGYLLPGRAGARGVDLVQVNAEMRGTVVYPGEGATDLIGKHHEAAAEILHQAKSGPT